ncbi:Protein of unknown function [Bacillus mobilis]|nr:Protein of unknown function [Bacillus mobilis]
METTGPFFVLLSFLAGVDPLQLPPLRKYSMITKLNKKHKSHGTQAP